MTGGELRCRAHVEHDDLPGLGAAQQLLAADLLGVLAVLGAEVPDTGRVDVGQVRGRDRAQLRVQRGDVGVGEPVPDRRAVPRRGDQPGQAQRLQVRRRGRQPQPGGGGEVGDTARALGEQVQQLQALPVTQRLAHPRQLLEQLRLASRITHGLLQYSMEQCRREACAVPDPIREDGMSGTTAGATTAENTGGVELATIVDEGLGNSTYVVDLGDGGALVVDPPRDLRAVRAATGEGRLAHPVRRRHPPARRFPLRRPAAGPRRRRAGAGLGSRAPPVRPPRPG